MQQILKRFSEPSSWAAIGGALMLFGLTVPEELFQHLAHIAAALAFAAGFFRPEAGSAE